MKISKIVIGALFTTSLLFANNDLIGFKDLSKAVEKLIDNQIYLEKKIINLESENKALKQSLEEMNSKLITLEKNDNTLNTNILKLGLQFEEFKNAKERIVTQKTDVIKQIFKDTKKLIVVAQAGVIRKTPEIICGNRAKTTKYGAKLNYTNKVGDWYLLEDSNYISKSIVKEYEDGKKYPMIKVKKSKKKGDC